MVPLPPPPPLSGSAPAAAPARPRCLWGDGCLRRKSRGPGRSSLGGVGRGGRGGRSASAEGPGGNKQPPRRELGWSGRRWALVFAAAPAPCALWSRRLQNAQPLDVKAHSGASRSQGSGSSPHPSSSQGGARATGAVAQWEREPETPGPTLPQRGPRLPPELARLPAREETHSSDHQEQTWRPQPWAWESLFGVLQQCLGTRVSPSLPPRKPRPFSGSLGLQHPCLLQPPKSGKPQTAGLGYSVSGRARPPSASVPRPGHLPRAAQNNWEEALAGCGGWLLGFSTSIEWFLRRIRCCQWRPGRLSLSSFWSP
ncbi:uncharacterized protein LOC114677425 [Macaca mulatta]